jgi:hypothetical protein
MLCVLTSTVYLPALLHELLLGSLFAIEAIQRLKGTKQPSDCFDVNFCCTTLLLCTADVNASSSIVYVALIN